MTESPSHSKAYSSANAESVLVPVAMIPGAGAPASVSARLSTLQKQPALHGEANTPGTLVLIYTAQRGAPSL